jgi:hypothetical protein
MDKDLDPLERILIFNPDLREASLRLNCLEADKALQTIIRILRAEYPGDYDAPPLPQEATDLLPGSAMKLDLLERRAEAGEQLFHPEEFPNELYARLITVARNGRPLRSGLAAESFAQQEEEAEWEDERIIAMKEFHYLHKKSAA